ncbi:DUF3781 domain-containing protein [Spirochaeta cellobiosiphila]|uniref:DUF3781 domain-containing protein n=1 Tax=Spirochaeta cellobiosiphila TaxID=504483 RepID=UPI00041C096E|nr:DUF3781 domain-containing protein [Spirochaeta cellobiosiphila]
MKHHKREILNKLCYTELVYGCIRKKLSIDLPDQEIEEFIIKLIEETLEEDIKIHGKNFYLENKREMIKITVNRNTYRVITVDRMNN